MSKNSRTILCDFLFPPAKLIADSVMPGLTYKYEVYIDNKKINFDYPLRFKTPFVKVRVPPYIDVFLLKDLLPEPFNVRL